MAWVKIHSLVKSRRHLERHRRLVGFLTRSITWARVIWISYCSPDCATRLALFVFRGATRISLWYSNWSACEEWSVLLTFGAGAMVATPHSCYCLSIFRGRARPMWVAKWFHVSPIPMIYDSGAFVLVPARKKRLRMALCFFAKHFSLLEPADGTCRRRAYTTLCVTHRFVWFHLMCKLSAQGV